MALLLTLPFPAAGSSVSVSYHNIGALTASKAPDPINGSNNWAVEFTVCSYASQNDRAAGIPPLQSSRWQCPDVALDQPILPQLYAFLGSTPAFAGSASV